MMYCPFCSRQTIKINMDDECERCSCLFIHHVTGSAINWISYELKDKYYLEINYCKKEFYIATEYSEHQINDPSKIVCQGNYLPPVIPSTVNNWANRLLKLKALL